MIMAALVSFRCRLGAVFMSAYARKFGLLSKNPKFTEFGTFIGQLLSQSYSYPCIKNEKNYKNYTCQFLK